MPDCRRRWLARQISAQDPERVPWVGVKQGRRLASATPARSAPDESGPSTCVAAIRRAPARTSRATGRCHWTVRRKAMQNGMEQTAKLIDNAMLRDYLARTFQTRTVPSGQLRLP